MISTMSRWFKDTSKCVVDSPAYLFWRSSNIPKYQLGAPAQMWQEYSMQGWMVDL